MFLLCFIIIITPRCFSFFFLFGMNGFYIGSMYSTLVSVLVVLKCFINPVVWYGIMRIWRILRRKLITGPSLVMQHQPLGADLQYPCDDIH